MAVATLALVGFATGAQANPSFTNGNFSTFSLASNPGCSNSTPQVVNNSVVNPTSSNLGSWVTSSYTNSGGTSFPTTYTFVLNASNYQSFTPLGTDNGTPSCTNIGLQAPQSGQPAITPPVGTSFLAADPSYENGTYPYANGTAKYTVAQTITGLIPGSSYTVFFNMAAGQQSGYVGSSTDWWTVGLGDSAGCAVSSTCATANTPHLGLPDTCSPNPPFTGGCGGGFSGWVSEEIGFVADAANEVLWFLGNSTAATGQPPFVLLNGVSLVVPEPPAYGMLMVALLVLLGVRRASRRKG